MKSKPVMTAAILINDILAFKAADLGIMTVQQGDKRPEMLRKAADVILDDIIKVVDVVKQLK